LQADPRIERDECQVGYEHADDDQEREKHQERPRQIHVLTLQRIQQHRAGRRQRQHDGGDLGTGNDVR
jgi:hypothetical protein